MSSAKAAYLAAALAAAALAPELTPAVFAADAFPPPPVASYQITCRLDAEKKTVEGTEVLTWKNTTSRPARTLQFHLYLNAFRNTLSSFWKESEGKGRDGKPRPENWGSIEILRMTGAEGEDLLASLPYISPDDGNPHDRTVAEVIPSRPVAPGETVSIAMDFVSHLPRVATRTGYKGDFFFVVQWFPKIGVFEETGWNCHQFHATTEFFADFGNYDVSIDVPSRYRGKVGATGRRVEEREASDGRVLYRFQQQGVHDFAWTADPAYLVYDDTFREAGLGDVRLILLLQPEHASQVDRHFKAAKAALSGYGRILGSYPYGTLTIVDPPWGAQGAGGMEYPTLITAGTSWSAPRRVQRPEGVTVHETGHQFFYGLLASNEFEEAWLDEGFNSYMTDRVMASVFGPDHVSLSVFGLNFPLGIDKHYPVDANRRYFEVADWDILASDSWKFRDSQVVRRPRLLEDGADARDARAAPRNAGDGPRPPPLRGSLALQASDDAGLRRRRQRLDRPQLVLVLRPDLLFLGDRRLRRVGRRQHAGEGAAGPLREGREALARAPRGLPEGPRLRQPGDRRAERRRRDAGRGPASLRGRPRAPRALGRRGPLEALPGRARGRA